MINCHRDAVERMIFHEKSNMVNDLFNLLRVRDRFPVQAQVRHAGHLARAPLRVA